MWKTLSVSWFMAISGGVQWQLGPYHFVHICFSHSQGTVSAWILVNKMVLTSLVERDLMLDVLETTGTTSATLQNERPFLKRSLQGGQPPFASAWHQEEVLKNIGFPMASELLKRETNLLSREQVMYQFDARTAAEEGS